MGQGKEVKTRPDPKVEIQEKGEIFLFYRPKVDKDETHGPDDVQRMYIVLRPESAAGRAVEEKQAPDSGKEGRKHRRDQGGGDGGAGAGKEGGHHEGGRDKEEVNVEEQPLLRLVVMGRKSLPDPAKHGRPYWGYVELVSTKLQEIKDALKEEEYSTATRGAGGARAGRGRVPHPEARVRPRPAHPPRVQAGGPHPRRRGAAGGAERGARGVLPRAGQEPRPALRRRRTRRGRRVPRAAEQAPRGVPGAPAGRVREPAVLAGGPAGPAQLRGVRAAAHRGVGRRGGGARAGAGGGSGGGGGGGAAGRRVLGPGQDVRRGGRREAAAERELGLGRPLAHWAGVTLCACPSFVDKLVMELYSCSPNVG